LAAFCPWRGTRDRFAEPFARSILYANPTTGRCDIYRFDLKDHSNTRLTSDERFEGSPRFLPTGDGFVFEREDDGRRHIIFRSLTNDDEAPITGGDIWDDIIDVSPDGEWILVSRSAYLPFASGRQSRTYLLSRVDSKKPPEEVGQSALFIRDGSIAFNLTGVKDGVPPELFIRTTETAEKKRLGAGVVAGRDPAGRRLAVIQSGWQDGSCDKQLAILDAETGAEAKFAWGFSPFFLDDGVSYFRGFPATKNREFLIFRNGMESEVECPYGIVSDPTWVSATENCAFFWVREFRPREFSIYQLDAKTVKFTKLLTVPDPRVKMP